jgi:Ca-activated chloride channel family protein
VKLGAGDTIPNKDFVLRWQVAGQAPRFAVLTHKDGGEGSFYLLAQPPAEAAAAASVAPRELVFVLDTSSSMAGAPLDKARELVRVALRDLRPDDTFQIVRFDDRASALGARPIAAKPRNVELALDWLGRLEAGGGTEMTTGIRAAFDFPRDPARLRLVVFLTDGYIGNEDEILAEVQDRLGDARLFSFGVGTAVNRYLLEEMASIGRGVAQVIRPDEDTAQVVAAFHRRIARPVLTDLAIDWNGLEVAELTPKRIPDLFLGQPLVVSGHYRKAGAATITVRGKQAGREVAFQVPVVLPEKDARPAIASVWARATIAELSRAQLRGERPEIRKRITELAVAHRLMSPYTAFVAVDASRTTAGGEAETIAVPVAIPEAVRGGKAAVSVPGGIVGGVAGGSPGGVVSSHSYDIDAEEARRDPVARNAAPAPEPVSAPAPEPPPPPTPSQPSLASAHRKALAKCLDGQSGSGKMNVRLQVDGAGNVKDAQVTGVSPAVADCAVTAARKLKVNAAQPAAVEAVFTY